MSFKEFWDSVHKWAGASQKEHDEVKSAINRKPGWHFRGFSNGRWRAWHKDYGTVIAKSGADLVVAVEDKVRERRGK